MRCRAESGVLDQALNRAREVLEAARRAAAEAARRRDELEAKIESYRVLQDRRQQRLEHVRNPKEASTLMAELDLARSVVAKEENDWVRSSDAVTQAQFKAAEEERKVAAHRRRAQAPEREGLEARRAELNAELAAAQRVREASASQLEQVPARPVRAASQGPQRRRDRPPDGRRLRLLPHFHPAQPPQPDQVRRHPRHLRSLRRDPVPARARAAGRMTRAGATLAW